MIGDTADMLSRLKLVLPARWFSDTTPVLDALLTGLASAWSGVYSLLGFVQSQTRIGSATGLFLDIASRDYLASALPRRAGEADAAYRSRVQMNLIGTRATRASLVKNITNLTGRTPAIFEPLNATDTGGYNVNLGYNVAGGYGSRSLPYQFFLKAYRPGNNATDNTGGYVTGPGGYNSAPMAYADVQSFAGTVSDAEIYAAAAAVLPANAIAWTNISNRGPFMDRNIVYPGSIPLDTDILYPNRNAMIGIAALSAAVFGSDTVVDGLACTPSSPASLTVVVGAGSITQRVAVDATAYGSLAADINDQIIKTGINLVPTNFVLTAPVNSGQSINYLIEAAFLETDTDPVVLPYVNAANVSQPYSGPSNSGSPQNTQRIQRVQLQLKPGVASPSGSQTTPAVDANWVPLYIVTVNYGQTAITAADITVAPGAPFLAYKLPALRPGFSTMQVFTSSGAFTVPNGVTTAKVTVIGGGGGGGYHSTMPSGGGGAGGQAIGIVNNLPQGQSIAVTVGSGGAALTTPGTGNAGGSSSFGAYMLATGGAGGLGGTTVNFSNAGGAGGVGSGGQVNIGGSQGSDAIVVACRGGDGGGPGNGRASSGPLNGISAPGFGGGGGGGGTTTGAGPVGYPGGAGGAGVVIIEY